MLKYIIVSILLLANIGDLKSQYEYHEYRTSIYFGLEYNFRYLNIDIDYLEQKPDLFEHTLLAQTNFEINNSFGYTLNCFISILQNPNQFKFSDGIFIRGQGPEGTGNPSMLKFKRIGSYGVAFDIFKLLKPYKNVRMDKKILLRLMIGFKNYDIIYDKGAFNSFTTTEPINDSTFIYELSLGFQTHMAKIFMGYGRTKLLVYGPANNMFHIGVGMEIQDLLLLKSN